MKGGTFDDLLRDPEFRKQYPPEWLGIFEDEKVRQDMQQFLDWVESLTREENIGRMSVDEMLESTVERLRGVLFTMLEQRVREMERAGRDMSHVRAWLAMRGT